jgi:hypothetical protein
MKSTVRKFRTVQNEGDRIVERDIEFYNLDIIISVLSHFPILKAILLQLKSILNQNITFMNQFIIIIDLKKTSFKSITKIAILVLDNKNW